MKALRALTGAPLRDALGFLTVLPVRGRWPLGRAAVAAFPLAGLVIGSAWAAAAFLGLHIGGPLVAAALVLAVDFAITGGLHLDGVADTADGLASHRPPDRVGEVMKDPRIGAVGAAALITTLILRFALLAAVIAAPDSWLAIALAPVAGRLALVCLLRTTRPRSDSLAKGPAEAATGGALAVAAIVTAAAALAAAATTPVTWPIALASIAIAMAVVHATARYWNRRLGQAGDLLGAAAILAETTTLAVLSAWPSSCIPLVD